MRSLVSYELPARVGCRERQDLSGVGWVERSETQRLPDANAPTRASELRGHSTFRVTERGVGVDVRVRDAGAAVIGRDHGPAAAAVELESGARLAQGRPAARAGNEGIGLSAHTALFFTVPGFHGCLAPPQAFP